MRFFDYLKMAFKYLTRQKMRSFLTIVAITVGSLSLILMTSLILSVHKSLVDQFKEFGAFDLVTVIKDPNSVNSNSLLSANGDPSQGKKIDDTTLAAMKKLPHVVGATAVVNNFGISTMKLEGQDKKTWASITAYDPSNDVFDLPIASGRKLASTDLDKIIVGTRFAEDMGYNGRAKDLIGKRVLLNYRSGGGNAPDWGALPEKPPANADRDWYESQQNQGIDIPAEIVGITGSGALDDGTSYITLAWAKRLSTNVSWQHQECQRDQPCTNSLTIMKEDNLVHQGYGSIVLKADSKDNIGVVADSVKALGYGANTAQKMLDQINRILFIIGIVLSVIGGISLFVATIGIVNTMIMATYERTREIGVLRACGATRATIRHLFTIEAALLGFWGGISGMVLSLILGQIGGAITRSHSASLGSLPINDIGHFPLWLVIVVIAFTTLLGMLSGLFPAIRAARLNPVEALRYE
jgi:putative ABC transport system permease protein